MTTPVTLQQIARKANVSTMTVSNILAGRYQPTPTGAMERAQKIRRLARELGYRPNGAAKAMVSGRFASAALVLGEVELTSMLPQKLLSGIHAALAERDMHLMVTSLPDHRLTDEGYVPKILREVLADGLLVNYNAAIPPRMVALVHHFALPCVWINSKQDADCVYPDDSGAAEEVTRRLLALGHREIAYLDFCHDPDTAPAGCSGVDRAAAYARAMTAAGLSPRRVGSPQMRDDVGIVPAIADYLRAHPAVTACVCYQTLESRAAVAAAMLLGRALGRDLSVATFSDDTTNDLGPMVAYMQLPEHEVGRAAVAMLADKINRPERPIPPHVLPFAFVPGQTFGPPPGR